MEAISRLETIGAEIRYLKASLHFYGMASHLIHADKSGLEIVADRVTRPEPGRSIVAAAQAARIFSDIANLWAFCSISISDAFGVPFRNSNAIMGQSGRSTALSSILANVRREPGSFLRTDEQGVGRDHCVCVGWRCGIGMGRPMKTGPPLGSFVHDKDMRVH